MRISKAQAEQNRQAIVLAAMRLFRERGYDAVGIAEVMTEAGFTHGGFYNHFSSKEELAAETFRLAFAQQREAARTLDGTLGALRKQLHRYLSSENRDAVGGACPTAPMVADAARQGGKVQAEFAHGIAEYVRDFSEAIRTAVPDGDAAEQRTTATRLLAESVGALVLAQACAEADAALSDELLAAGREGVDRLLDLVPPPRRSRPRARGAR